CLDSIACERGAIEVAVIDNASRDASAEIARQHRSAPQVIASGANLGFGRAINQATRGRTFDYLLLLNPDAVLQEGALEALLAAARQDPLAGLYGGRSIRPDGTAFAEQFQRAPTLIHALKFAACFGYLPGTAA